MECRPPAPLRDIISNAMNDTIEVRIEAAVDLDGLMSLLADERLLGAWEDEGILHLYWSREEWNSDVLERLRAALSLLTPFSAQITVLELPDRDWNAGWLESIQPVRIGKKLRIRQSWNPADPSFEGVDLIIDPKRAFGSGYHATTQLLIERMEICLRPGARVLDIGTGSGILAMAALRLGARSALGIDNDPAAVECARENSRANGFGPELDLRLATAGEAGPGTFDLVLANLDRRTLLEVRIDLPPLVAAGGTALLSGLQAADCEEIIDAYRGCGAKVVGKYERDEWAALELRF